MKVKMRFIIFIGISLILSLRGLEATIEVKCKPENSIPCFPDISDVDDEDFRIIDTIVQDLTIWDNKGVKFLPVNLLSSSPNVKSISISNCSIATIKKIHFKGLSNLEGLYLDRNLIENVANDSFVDLVKLERLGLSNNQIKSLEAQTFDSLKSLEELYLQNNKIEKIASDFWFVELVSLKELDLSQNEIHSLERHTFASQKKLKELKLQNNKIENIESDAFAGLVSLQTLDLSGNRLQLLGRHTFASLKSLWELDLSNNEIHYLHPKIFKSLTNVEHINIDDNEIFHLDENTFESLTNLKTLTIKQNKLKELFSEWFRFCQKLERISLRGNKIKNVDRTIFDYLPNLANFDLRYKAGNDANWLQISNSKCGVSKIATGLIVHGRNFKRGDFPWTVALTMNKKYVKSLLSNTQPPKYFCTGTLISTTFVLSAAHCINQKGLSKPLLARDILAFFGAHDLENYQESARFALSPKTVIVHEGWNPTTTQYDADLSLLEFEKERISFGDFVQPICFWSSKKEPDEIRGEVVGWGSEDRTKKHETVAKVVEAVIQPNEQCFLDQKKLVDISSNRTFCAGLRNGSGVCTGDSGGGFVIKVNGISFLKGIVSSSLVKDNFCDVNNHAIYTNVLKYKDWIEKMTGGALLSPAEGISAESGNTVYCSFTVEKDFIDTYSTCTVNQTIDTEEFILGAQLDNNIGLFHISKNKKVEFLPKGIGESFPNVKWFSGTGCGLTIVRDFYFKNMKNLEDLVLSDNKITTIESKSFEDLISVTILNLGYNLIETLDDKLFATMVNLKFLSLHQNKIKFLSPTTFNIPGGRLMRVYLGSNVCIDKLYNIYDSNFNQLEPDLKTNCTRPKRFS